ncbi:MAG: PDZ domain-containing protein [Phycisphaerae bacterium]|nr:PDZ domain-containing protein [Phycisphaerae bacterium]NIP54228.1 PDZ domain-containing protein [Phycisphaerae bacterium]NIS50179.1 PDZ domain-containing protein [Phycisphaerae bacterium]NIU07833.1 PDZ domain-containing protein [Phycisphaerae bacterium]NIU55442.1 PDZ domain-containing protein [Phycisphaerae bacterium]
MDLDKICTSRKIALLLSFLVLFLAGGCAEKPEGKSDVPINHKVLAEFKIARNGDPILLPVTFKEKEYLFMLDTGSSHTVFDSSFRHELGEVKDIKKGLTSGSPILAEFFNAPNAFLGPFDLKESGDIACLDLNIFKSVLGKNVSGLIGMSFLRKYVIRIDFDKGTLSFLQPMQEQHPDWGIELVMEYDSLGWPQITGLVLDDIKVDFVIDTGANSTGGLVSDIFEKTLSENKLKTSEILFATASGVIRKREMRIKSLSVGLLNYTDIIFGEANMSHLGLSFLSRHIVTFDFPNSRMYLKKGKGFKKNDQSDMSGLHLLRISDKTVVYSVDEDSPAQKSGITANDIILRVGDKDANAYDILDLRRLLMSGDKRNITMTIKHGDDVKDVSFLLEKKI